MSTTACRPGGCALLVLALVAGCASTPPSAQLDSSPGEDLPVLWETSGTYSRAARSFRILARDRATLSQIPLAEVPVDFDTQMVLIAGLGATPTNDFGIRITRVWREGSRIRVQERQIHPGLQDGRTVDPASPWTIVVIPRSDLNVEGYTVTVPPRLLSGG